MSSILLLEDRIAEICQLAEELEGKRVAAILIDDLDITCLGDPVRTVKRTPRIIFEEAQPVTVW